MALTSSQGCAALDVPLGLCSQAPPPTIIIPWQPTQPLLHHHTTTAATHHHHIIRVVRAHSSKGDDERTTLCSQAHKVGLSLPDELVVAVDGLGHLPVHVRVHACMHAHVQLWASVQNATKPSVAACLAEAQHSIALHPPSPPSQYSVFSVSIYSVFLVSPLVTCNISIVKNSLGPSWEEQHLLIVAQQPAVIMVDGQEGGA